MRSKNFKLQSGSNNSSLKLLSQEVSRVLKTQFQLGLYKFYAMHNYTITHRYCNYSNNSKQIGTLQW